MMWRIGSLIERLRRSATRHVRVVNPVVGRDAFCRQLIRAASDNGSVLLFGGRQSGKTSILRRTIEISSTAGDDTGVLDLAVMLDLMRLPHDSTPEHFFRFAAEEVSAYARAIGLRGSHPVSRSVDLAGFERVVAAVAKAATTRPVRVVLLIDEANRVLGGRFPRGFLDNLFSLLYGQNSSMPPCVAVFAGAQELYAFSADGTSPIGSRAARLTVKPIALGDAAALLATGGQNETPTEWVPKLHDLTGGHAGLLAYAGRILARNTDMADRDFPSAVANIIRSDKAELFQIWAQALSPEARLIAEILASRGRTAMSESANVLSATGFHAFRVERAWQELQFTGLAIQQGDELLRQLPLFWQSVVWRTLPDGSESELSAWKLVERLELRLRFLVRSAYDAHWGANANKRMEKTLGAEAWNKILENQAKSARAYRYSTPQDQNEILNFAYIGQLKILMFDGTIWPTFKPKFTDKRQLEEMIADIAPVRNEQAHFRKIPERELQRCRLTCEDLLAILGE
jgi:hypothetical protein